jgi:hypothetical protein
MTWSDIEALLGLPFNTLALIAAGYLGYRLEATGRDGTHSTIDVIFISATFAMIAQLGATITLAVLTRANIATEVGGLSFVNAIVPGLVGLVVALICAALWRATVGSWVTGLLRNRNILRSDRYPSAWMSMVALNRKKVTSLMVCMTDGRMLMCDAVADYQAANHGGIMFGPDGSLALCVTHNRPPDQKEWIKQSPLDPDNPEAGYAVTYVPASQVAYTKIWWAD